MPISQTAYLVLADSVLHTVSVSIFVFLLGLNNGNGVFPWLYFNFGRRGGVEDGRVGGFMFCDPARFMFNGSASVRANALTGGCGTQGTVVICNKNSVVHDKLLRHVRSSLRRTKISCMGLKNMRPGPASPGICRNVRLTHGRNISFVLPMKKNSIVSATGTVTTKIPCRNSF